MNEPRGREFFLFVGITFHIQNFQSALIGDKNGNWTWLQNVRYIHSSIIIIYVIDNNLIVLWLAHCYGKFFDIFFSFRFFHNQNAVGNTIQNKNVRKLLPFISELLYNIRSKMLICQINCNPLVISKTNPNRKVFIPEKNNAGHADDFTGVGYIQ